MSQQTVADLLQAGFSEGRASFTLEYLDTELVQEVQPLSLQKLWDLNSVKLGNLKAAGMKHFLIRGYALKRIINEKCGSRQYVEVMGFNIHVGRAKIGPTELNLKRINALVAIAAYKEHRGIESAMFLRLPESIKEILRPISAMIVPGLHFVFAAVRDHKNTDAKEPAKFFKDEKHIKPMIVLGTIVMDWMAYNAKLLKLGQPLDTLKAFSEMNVGLGEGSFAALVTNNGWRDDKEIDLDEEESKFVVDALSINAMPTIKGGIQRRAVTVFQSIFDKAKKAGKEKKADGAKEVPKKGD